MSVIFPERFRMAAWASTLLACMLLCTPLSVREAFAMKPADLQQFASEYAAAWSSQDPEALASFYAADGVLIVNGGEPAVGRAAVAAKARSFMEAFPDMVVALDRLDDRGHTVEFHWIWTGTNTGPGGTGNAVRLKGYEEWTFGPNGLIARSDGHYDDADYQRQVNGEGGK